MSVPCGESRDGLPIGLQIFTKHFDEATMLRIAYNYERATTR
jgi:aspartyl-tRNA(Asn)/glutamyl-tRNA(Gln) amidotransferase subunit A